jgi:hypothetical protein
MAHRALLVICECSVIGAVLARILIRRNSYLTFTTGRGTNAVSAKMAVPLVLIAMAGIVSIILLMKMLAHR